MAVLIGACALHCFGLELLSGLCFLFFLAVILKPYLKFLWALPSLVTITQAQLREELSGTQALALSKLSAADYQLKQEVNELLVKAVKHLDPPIADARVLDDFYLLCWHRDGLRLVYQARQMIDAYATSQACTA